MKSYFETLNLDANATIVDIKSSYRQLAKRYHPDSGSSNYRDAYRFQQVHEAYKALMNEKVSAPEGSGGNRGEQARASDKNGDSPKWRFEGASNEGEHVLYVLRVAKEAARDGLKLVLPWKAEDACPRCLGAGHTLATVFGGSRLVKVRCPKCDGEGVVTHNSSVNVDLSPDMIRQGRVRIKNLGRYNPTRGTRGDLIVDIKYEWKTDHQESGIYNV